jgi:acylphosphatase
MAVFMVFRRQVQQVDNRRTSKVAAYSLKLNFLVTNINDSLHAG